MKLTFQEKGIHTAGKASGQPLRPTLHEIINVSFRDFVLSCFRDKNLFRLVRDRR